MKASPYLHGTAACLTLNGKRGGDIYTGHPPQPPTTTYCKTHHFKATTNGHLMLRITLRWGADCSKITAIQPASTTAATHAPHPQRKGTTHSATSSSRRMQRRATSYQQRETGKQRHVLRPALPVRLLYQKKY